VATKINDAQLVEIEYGFRLKNLLPICGSSSSRSGCVSSSPEWKSGKISKDWVRQSAGIEPLLCGSLNDSVDN